MLCAAAIIGKSILGSNASLGASEQNLLALPLIVCPFSPPFLCSYLLTWALILSIAVFIDWWNQRRKPNPNILFICKSVECSLNVKNIFMRCNYKALMFCIEEFLCQINHSQYEMKCTTLFICMSSWKPNRNSVSNFILCRFRLFTLTQWEKTSLFMPSCKLCHEPLALQCARIKWWCEKDISQHQWTPFSDRLI